MDRNLFLAVALSIGVYAAWFGFIDKKTAHRPQVGVTVPDPSPAPDPSPLPASAPAPLAHLERETILARSDEFAFGGQKIRVDPRGASIVSSLYQGPLGAVELVHDPRPGLFSTWPEMTFGHDKSAPGLYRASRKDGLLITKEFVAAAGESLPRLRIRLQNPTRRVLSSGEWTLSIGPGLSTVASEQEENPKVWRALGLAHGQSGLNGKIEQFKSAEEHAGPYRWVGVDNRYFLAAVIMPEKGFDSLTAAPTPPQVTLKAGSIELRPGEERTWELPFYLGAKGNNILSPYGAGLERSIDFGFFAQLGRLVLRALGQLHKATGNWGWSIIVLTVLLQFLLFPLTYKSLRAAASMKKLQPEIAKLQQKYGKDPSRLNTETMELYKKSGANPLGGCLPMLMQMPIFIALFNALRNSWELHGAPWIFWITDLSAKDPYYVLPLVMGALMLLQQKLAPAATADPAQAKIMMWMPVIFTFMFLKFPAGLVLYWLTNSVFSTVQQLALKDHFERHP